MTLQAPDAANKESDLISCLTDLMAERMGRQFKHIFVTRNEFKELENLIPENTAQFLSQMTAVSDNVKSFNGDVLGL